MTLSINDIRHKRHSTWQCSTIILNAIMPCHVLFTVCWMSFCWVSFCRVSWHHCKWWWQCQFHRQGMDLDQTCNLKLFPFKMMPICQALKFKSCRKWTSSTFYVTNKQSCIISFTLKCFIRRHDTHHNDIQHSDIQHTGPICKHSALTTLIINDI
jgi:hypothetical protein